jgi:hypothetical protein
VVLSYFVALYHFAMQGELEASAQAKAVQAQKWNEVTRAQTELQQAQAEVERLVSKNCVSGHVACLLLWSLWPTFDVCRMKAELAKADVRPDQVVAMEEQLTDATALTSALSAKVVAKDAEVRLLGCLLSPCPSVHGVMRSW